jgi:hypothetical protein
MAKPNITKEDVTELAQFVDDFSNNVIKNYHAGNALDVFEKNLSRKEFLSLITKKIGLGLRDKFSFASTPAKEAKSLLKYCEAVLPIMLRVFGEDLVLKSLPTKPSQEEHVSHVCEALGAHDLVDLYAKAQQLKGQASPVTTTKKPPAPGQH